MSNLDTAMRWFYERQNISDKKIVHDYSPVLPCCDSLGTDPMIKDVADHLRSIEHIAVAAKVDPDDMLQALGLRGNAYKDYYSYRRVSEACGVPCMSLTCFLSIMEKSDVEH